MDKFKFDIDRTTYAMYKLDVENMMERYNWYDLANGIETRPTGSLTETVLGNSERITSFQRDWDARNAQLDEFLRLSLRPEWKPLFRHVPAGNGVELWNAIVNEFERETPKERSMLLTSLYSISQFEDESLDSYVNRLHVLATHFEKYGDTVSENSKVTCFLKGLNSVYMPDDVSMLMEQNISLELAAELIASFTFKDLGVKTVTAAAAATAEPVGVVNFGASAKGYKTILPAIEVSRDSKHTTDKTNGAITSPLTSSITSNASSNMSLASSANATSPLTSTATSPLHTSQQQHPPPPHSNSNNSNSNGHHTHAHAHPHRTAFAPTTQHRGLNNAAGENNCFLNVTIQALWHLGPFRTQLIAFIGEYSSSKHRIPAGGLLECLCNLFIQYEFTDQRVLPPTELRESLCALSSQFKLGKIADANEAFDTILQRIHAELASACPHEHKCLSHEVFGGSVMEQTVCNRCSATSEPTLRSDFILCFQAAELLLEAKALFAKASYHSTATSCHGAGAGAGTGAGAGVNAGVRGGGGDVGAKEVSNNSNNDAHHRHRTVRATTTSGVVPISTPVTNNGSAAGAGNRRFSMPTISTAITSAGGRLRPPSICTGHDDIGVSAGDGDGGSGSGGGAHGSDGGTFMNFMHFGRRNTTTTSPPSKTRTTPTGTGGGGGGGGGGGDSKAWKEYDGGDAKGGESEDAAATHRSFASYTSDPSAHFGAILSKCMAVSQRSCPSNESSSSPRGRGGRNESKESERGGGGGGAGAGAGAAGGRGGVSAGPGSRGPGPDSRERARGSSDQQTPQQQGTTTTTSRSTVAAKEAAAARDAAETARLERLAVCCRGRATVHTFSLDAPLALALSIGWMRSTETAATLQDFYSLVAYSIKLSDLFSVLEFGAAESATRAEQRQDGGTVENPHGSNNNSNGPTIITHNPSYIFRGLVCYYGLHYVSIFQSMETENENFLLFDDQNIKVIGDWAAVKDKCVKSLYQPVLLLYELDSTSIQ